MGLKLAILASGSGSNAQTMFEAMEQGILDADIRLVFSNRLDAKVLERAKKFGIATCCLDHKAFASREDFDKKMCEVIREHGADTVAMAGYMRMVTPHFLNAFPQRVLNIHPAILPSFAGAHGALDAVNYGVKFSGCSVHFVSEEMDAGPIIIQGIVPCDQDDTEQDLQNKIHALEHRIYVQALQWLSQNRLNIQGHTVHLLPCNEDAIADNTADNTAIPSLIYSTENTQGNASQHTPKATFLGVEHDERYPLGAMIYPPLERGF